MRRRVAAWVAAAAFGVGYPGVVAAQVLHTGHATAAARSIAHDVGAAGDATATVTVAAQLERVPARAEGAVYLWFTLHGTDAAGAAATVQVRVPLASTGEAYGEERSCTVDGSGVRRMTFTAGLDEANFVGFRAAAASREYRLSVNKYLCRVLAAPFRCGGVAVALSSRLGGWTAAAERGVDLRSTSAVTLRAAPVQLQTGAPFDAAQCAAIAPSNGMCCVAGRSTEWHCGGTPAGSGWHQVSGECFHRETGGSCHE